MATSSTAQYWDDDERSTRFVPYNPRAKVERFCDDSIGDVLKAIAKNNYSNAKYRLGGVDTDTDTNDYDGDYGDFGDFGDYGNDYAFGGNIDSDYDYSSETHEEYEAENSSEGPSDNENDNNTSDNTNEETREQSQKQNETNSKMIDDVMYKKFCYC
jgi:hypothetical protein